MEEKERCYSFILSRIPHESLNDHRPHSSSSCPFALPPFSSITRHFITHGHLSHILPHIVKPALFRSQLSSTTIATKKVIIDQSPQPHLLPIVSNRTQQILNSVSTDKRNHRPIASGQNILRHLSTTDVTLTNHPTKSSSTNRLQPNSVTTIINHHHHHQSINVPTAGAQAFLMNYPQGERP
jgi:hypothetical protein